MDWLILDMDDVVRLMRRQIRQTTRSTVAWLDQGEVVNLPPPPPPPPPLAPSSAFHSFLLERQRPPRKQLAPETWQTGAPSRCLLCRATLPPCRPLRTTPRMYHHGLTCRYNSNHLLATAVSQTQLAYLHLHLLRWSWQYKNRRYEDRCFEQDGKALNVLSQFQRPARLLATWQYDTESYNNKKSELMLMRRATASV